MAGTKKSTKGLVKVTLWVPKKDLKTMGIKGECTMLGCNGDIGPVYSSSKE